VLRIIQSLCNSSLRAFQKYFGLHHISFESWRGIAKPTRKTIPNWGNL
jgi:hypothetical protein